MHEPTILLQRNINDMLPEALLLLRRRGVRESSRAGNVIVAPGPVISTYTRPCERVLFSKERDANPFFHFFESLWMLAGRDDVFFLEYFNSRIGEFSDDGETLNGAYGARWLHWIDGDDTINQLEYIIGGLQRDPSSRRMVLEMWGATDLTNRSSKDLPCNTHIYFDCRYGELNMTVCNRSNDAIWGAYGANVVHFSVLQEYIAAAVKVPVGHYHQFSNNLHIYTDVPKYESLMSGSFMTDNFYIEGSAQSYPLVSKKSSIKNWNTDLCRFMEYADGYIINGEQNLTPPPYIDPFFSLVAEPMLHTWVLYKNGRKKDAITEQAPQIKASDWKLDCMSWMRRRSGDQLENEENRNDAA